ncbi:MAG: type II toxin-antitoxin system Phd/YefM family antitoxin [Treponema sp.]|jgi:prevent-host-death family protein|nr:type II toxin-antitoxin system Phd/YefM family antitoxin [Treponema sp.]
MAINLRENVKPISYIKTNAAQMMKYVNERKNPVIITQNGEAKAVLMDIETYQDTEDAFALMNIIKLAEKDITEGNVKKADDVFKNMREIIAKNG